MTKGRLEAFSDGVIAILITILVLELKIPHGATWHALEPLVPIFLMYVLSFLVVGIYWVNHHHLLHTVERVTGGILWANLHLLFWLSMIPFTTGWMGENHSAPLPTAIYGVVLVCAAFAYNILSVTIIRAHGRDSRLARAVGGDRKGKLSVLLYVLSVPAAFVNVWISDALWIAVIFIWFVPDRRIERVES